MGILSRENTLCNNFIYKRGVGVFLRVGLFLGDYGSCVTRSFSMLCTLTSDWSSAEASPQFVLASGQGYGISGVTEFCSPRPGSKKLHVRK